MEPFPSFGGAAFSPRSKKVIRLILKGCANRPFFHISVQEYEKETHEPVIEQIGNYDPLPNSYNEKLVAINFQRLEHWLRQGASTTLAVNKILGLSGYFPVHPDSMEEAYRRRYALMNKIQQLKIEAAKFVSIEEEKSNELNEGPSSEISKNVESEEESPNTLMGKPSPGDDLDGRDSKS